MLRSISSDTVQMEQYMDFVRNRMFRQTLLCHRDVPLDRQGKPEQVFDMYVASNAEPEKPISDVRSNEAVVFRRPGSTMTTTEPLVKAAMLHLRDVWPLAVHFSELLGHARAKIQPKPAVVNREQIEAESRSLAQPLLRCYATTHVDLSVTRTRQTTTIDPQPVASVVAKRQSETSSRVTNLWHQTVPLDELQFLQSPVRRTPPSSTERKDLAHLAATGLVFFCPSRTCSPPSLVLGGSSHRGRSVTGNSRAR